MTILEKNHSSGNTLMIICYSVLTLISSGVAYLLEFFSSESLTGAPRLGTTEFISLTSTNATIVSNSMKLHKTDANKLL